MNLDMESLSNIWWISFYIVPAITVIMAGEQLGARFWERALRCKSRTEMTINIFFFSVIPGLNLFAAFIFVYILGTGQNRWF